jgi:FMN phosphatase YigB (HAD superfamily)
MIKAVGFDLDGVLVPFDECQFIKGDPYFKALAKKCASEKMVTKRDKIAKK